MNVYVTATLAVIMAGALSAGLCAAGGAQGGKPTSAERALAREWISGHLRQQGGFFSFTYDGSPPELAQWQFKQSARKLDSSRTQRVLTWTEPRTQLEIQCTAIEYADYPAVDWVLMFTNRGSADTPIIENIQALDVAMKAPAAGALIHHSLGDSNSADSFAPRTDSLGPEGSQELVLAPVGGRSSDGNMPFLNIDCHQQGVVLAVGWSGQWQTSFSRSGQGDLQLQAGQQLTHLRLHPGESIRTPSILLTFWQGSDELRGSNLLRQLLLAHYVPRRNGNVVFTPIAASVTDVDPGNNYEGPHLRVMPVYARRGIEVFWSDMDPQQWYPGEFPNGTGNWFPDLTKYPHGLGPVGDAAHAVGMDFLLWFEPERVAPGTQIDKEHPEFVMQPKGEWSKLFKLQDTTARRWLIELIDKQISDAHLDWIRWDFNIQPLGFWRRADEPDRQGISEAHYIEGLYEMMDEFRRRHPGLVIDICASGGRRLDIETLSRGVPLWHSDAQCTGKPAPVLDQLQNAGLWKWIPMHGCGNFRAEPSYEFRSAMTAGNAFVPFDEQGRPCAALPDAERQISASAAVYKKLRPYMLGDFYPLFAHSDSEAAWYGYQFHLPNDDAGMAMVFRRADCPDASQRLRLQGINGLLDYELSFQDSPGKRIVTGTELANLNVDIEGKPGSAILYYKRAK